MRGVLGSISGRGTACAKGLRERKHEVPPHFLKELCEALGEKG